jgi:hypothetical protein
MKAQVNQASNKGPMFLMIDQSPRFEHNKASLQMKISGDSEKPNQSQPGRLVFKSLLTSLDKLRVLQKYRTQSRDPILKIHRWNCRCLDASKLQHMFKPMIL